jgi:hypothetical protein
MRANATLASRLCAPEPRERAEVLAPVHVVARLGLLQWSAPSALLLCRGGCCTRTPVGGVPAVLWRLLWVVSLACPRGVRLLRHASNVRYRRRPDLHAGARRARARAHAAGAGLTHSPARARAVCSGGLLDQWFLEYRRRGPENSLRMQGNTLTASIRGFFSRLSTEITGILSF